MVVYFEPFTQENLKAIRGDFGATEETLKNDINILMEWMEKQPHLPNVTDEQWLTHYLLCCKNSIERAKKKLEDYYIARAQYPEMFTKRAEIVPHVHAYTSIMSYVPMPKLTKDCRRIIIYRIFDGSEFPYTAEHIVKNVQAFYDFMIKVDYASQYIIIFDLENVSLPIITAVFPAIKKLLIQMTKINPLRYSKFYVLNVSTVVEPLVNFTISLLSKKLAGRTVMWKKKREDLAEEIGVDVLPPIYGGTEKSIESLKDTFVDCMLEYADWLVAEESTKADLSKIPNANGSLTDIGEYGVEGSFRKINLD